MNVFIGPLRHLGSRRVHLEVEEELQFHLDLLTEEHCRQNMPLREAQVNARQRFGNVEQIRDECVTIARRSSQVVMALKWFFGFVFVTGILVRIFGAGTDYHITRVGDILMAVGVLSRLLLYLRGRTPARYVRAPDESVSLELNASALSVPAFDQRGRTPVERIVSSE